MPLTRPQLLLRCIAFLNADAELLDAEQRLRLITDTRDAFAEVIREAPISDGLADRFEDAVRLLREATGARLLVLVRNGVPQGRLRTAIEAVDRALDAAHQDVSKEVERWRVPLLELIGAMKLETSEPTPLAADFITACEAAGAPCLTLDVIDFARKFARHAIGRPLDAPAPSIAIPVEALADA
jgi:hypothetical protein